MNDDIIIVGCNFSGLYSAIRCIDSGINVTIIEKKHSYEDDIINYKIFNKNHSTYIQLLDRFSIKYVKYNLNFNEKTMSIIHNVINKTKHIPSKILNVQTFDKLCNTILSQNDYLFLKNNISNYSSIYCFISGLIGISMFNNELNGSNTFYIVEDDSSVLISRMVAYVVDNNAAIIYNSEVKDIAVDIHNNIIATTNNLSTKNHISKAILFAISKDNLFKIKYLKEKRKILNNITKYNIDSLYIYNDDSILNEYSIQNHLVNNMNIVYPIKKSSLHLWNIGVNSIIIREKIKNLYNNIFICSDFFSKNIFFANYTLENYDEIHNKIVNKYYL
jgi:outer membrane lipoprotein-sorting protein